MGRRIDDKLLYIGCGAAWLIATVYAIAMPAPRYQPQASQDQLAQFAIATLGDLQEPSIARNQEYCGVILESDAGALSVSRIYEGGPAECSFHRLAPPGSHVIASFHTHGGTDRDYDSEFPSIEDVEGDMAQRITGFIATPGGRVWQVDWRTGTVHQLCGESCLAQDRDYDPELGEVPQASYSRDELDTRAATGDRGF